MSQCDRFTTEQISQHLDGSSSAEEREAVNTHLPGCDACRARLEDLRELASAARAFVGIRPERDLWPAIEAELSDRPSQADPAGRSAGAGTGSDFSGPGPRRMRFNPTSMAIAASVAFLLASAAYFLGSARGRGTPDEVAIEAPERYPGLEPSLSALLDSLEVSFRRLAAESAGEDSEVAMILLEVLSTLDEVIEDAQQELRDRPDDPARHGYYTAVARKKADALLRGLALMGEV